MRLTNIRLSGFKSFVDPTNISLPSDLIGIVGPNGCGKSNVIDAVRWVMGESSAKTLRGDSIADVIFNGSRSRKPVAQASIELVFDNSDGKLGGAYSSYAEISVKRLLSRDGVSNYFLNNSKCRRKDITNLFLGTGLGPRSYSIIEQGMISRLIEAKPEEMRVYIEEAAGISKYKERRRETSNRIRHTRDNLDRINDLREEVNAQIKKLERQASAAEKYKTYQQEVRRLEAELIMLRVRALGQERHAGERLIAERENVVEANLAEQRTLEANLETTRTDQTEAQESFNQVQEKFYRAGAEIARIEQTIEHNQELRQRLQEELDDIKTRLENSESDSLRDRQALEHAKTSLEHMEPELHSLTVRENETAAELIEARDAMDHWRESWDGLSERLNQAQQDLEVQKTRIEHNEERLSALAIRSGKAESEYNSLQSDEERDVLQSLHKDKEVKAQELEKLADDKSALKEKRDQARNQQTEAAEKLHQSRVEWQQLRGRIASLEALQDNQRDQQSEEVSDWLSRRNFDKRDRLLDQLEVEAGWERAIETVLADTLDAIALDDIEQWSDLPQDALALVKTTSSEYAPERSLARKVKRAPQSLLKHVRVADSLQDAWMQRDQLGDGESIITQQAVWMGRDWLRVGSAPGAHDGAIERENELRQLRQTEKSLTERVKQFEQALAQRRSQLEDCDAEYDRQQARFNSVHEMLVGVTAKMDAQGSRIRQRLAELELHQEEIKQERSDAQERLEEAIGRAEQASTTMQALSVKRDNSERDRQRLAERLVQAEEKNEKSRVEAKALAIKVESHRSARQSLTESLQRLDQQLIDMRERRVMISAQLEQANEPDNDLKSELESALAGRVAVEGLLAEARTRLEQLDEKLQSMSRARSDREAAVQAAREALSEARMMDKELEVRAQTLTEQFAETEFTVEAVEEGLAQDANVEAWEENLAKMMRRIDRLGAINLAAIDEFSEQSERKAYLDAQYGDLTEALDTLEQAMRKIDKETKTRFKETFDQVNEGLSRLFPRLFGGGAAYLELDDDDLLNAGVTIMARPPGKRNSTIHLLSGGEKALTAVALVFSIFELNPSPFCLLDEVDAPLDDANVERFSSLVKEMSDRVQFIVITHNKATMEMVHQLMGVTMQEPGVSRLVAVDVDEAVRMANA